MEKTCIQCGQPFEATRSTARFCSTSCRVAHHRAKKSAQEAMHSAPPPPDDLDFDELRKRFVEAADEQINPAIPPNEWVEWVAVHSLGIGPNNNFFTELQGRIDTIARIVFEKKWPDKPTQDELNQATLWTLGILMDYFTQHIGVTSIATIETDYAGLTRDGLRDWQGFNPGEYEFQDERWEREDLERKEAERKPRRKRYR